MNILAKKLPGFTDIQQLNSWLPIVSNTLLVIACSFTLAQITWLLIPQPDPVGPLPAVTTRPAITVDRLQYAQIINKNALFGNYQATQVTQKIQSDAPETRLNLVLKGVLATDPMTNASVIIAMGKNGKEDIYGIDDKVTSATIKEIHVDRVILERNGQFETLRLPKEFSDNTLIDVGHGDSAELPSLAEIRNKVLKNPTSFTQYAIPVPYRENGKLRGYRLQQKGNNQLFSSLGLVSGDIVISVNDIPLDNPQKSIEALRALQNSNQVTLTLLRNGAEIPLQLEIP
ncbi:MAG: type II secretion system protein GspC [Gammaproteobacteria bacterium]|nr:type II secretion system protein GspC [Gammaproteobacteria bacterium]